MKVFWSWQSDTPSKIGNGFVRKALQAAVNEISSDHSLSDAERPEVDHDTKSVDGWVEIVNTIFRKIENAAVFVADVTPTIESNNLNKKSPNPNVMLELGYALKTLGSEPIILIWNTATGARPEDLPFDMRHRRGPVGYNLPLDAESNQIKRAQEKLTKELKVILAPLLAKALAQRDAALTFAMQIAREGDPSIWTQPGEKLEGHESFNVPGWKSFNVLESPRSYVRVVPYAWERAKPTRDQITTICNDSWMLCPLGMPSDGGSGWAENNDGIISILDSEMPILQTATAAQWFHKTGEVWSFDAGINIEECGIRRLDGRAILRNWYDFVFYTLGFYKKVNTEYPIVFPIRIELGISDIRNMCWLECAPDIGLFIQQPKKGIALRDTFAQIGLLRSFEQRDIELFIFDAYNKLLEAFGLDPAPQQDFHAIVKDLAWNSEIVRP